MAIFVDSLLELEVKPIANSNQNQDDPSHGFLFITNKPMLRIATDQQCKLPGMVRVRLRHDDQ